MAKKKEEESGSGATDEQCIEGVQCSAVLCSTATCPDSNLQFRSLLRFFTFLYSYSELHHVVMRVMGPGHRVCQLHLRPTSPPSLCLFFSQLFSSYLPIFSSSESFSCSTYVLVFKLRGTKINRSRLKKTELYNGTTVLMMSSDVEMSEENRKGDRKR